MGIVSTFFALWFAAAALAQQPGPASPRPIPQPIEAPAPLDTATDEAAEPEAVAPESPPEEAAEPVPPESSLEEAPEPGPPEPPAGEPVGEPPPEATELPAPPGVEAPLPVPAEPEAPTGVVPSGPAGPPAPAPPAQETPFVGPPLPYGWPSPPMVPPPADSDPSIIIVPSPQGPLQPMRDGLRDALLPVLPMRGLTNGLALLLLALASGLMARVARNAREPLLPDGILPTFLRLMETGARLLVVFFGLGVVAAWLPASLAPGLPWVVVAIAVAVGWSARDVLPDLVGWVFISLEGQLRAGQWLEVDGRRGRVERVGMRATRLRDHLDNILLIPNRHLVRAPVTADVGWPTIEVRLRLDPEHGPARIRAALREAVELSPWAAPCEPEVYRDGEAWVVRLDLLDGTFADRVEGTLAERVEEILCPSPLDRAPDGKPDGRHVSP